MKKLIVALVALTLETSLMANITTGTGEGYKGDIIVEVTREGDTITAIKVVDHSDTPRIAKRAGLLHDIGKAVDHEVEGTHIEIGMNLLRKYKESKAVIHAMSTHHGDYEPESLEAVIVTAADAISAARPGARRETLDTYVKRLEALEGIANAYDGVDGCFAIQAGREIRVMVVPDKINDTEMVLLTREIKKRIEDELDYPGQIKINLIREVRHVDYAK